MSTHIRELPTGKGFADIVFLPRRGADCPAMIFELKYDKSATGAIQQIKDKKYVSVLKEYHGNLLLAGINYDRKTKNTPVKLKSLKLYRISHPAGLLINGGMSL